MKPTKKNLNPKAGNKVRIIGGRWRRRVLPVAQIDGLRPTGNRIRETLFNWLMPYMQNARCLDLYAGTGALGLEALSRGAAFVQFVETNKAASSNLEKNLQTLAARKNEYALHQGDALRFLKGLNTEPGTVKTDSNNRAFDIVFLDPPFQSDLWQESAALLAESSTVSSDALIYVERPRETKFTTPAGWREYRSLNAGAINATLYAKRPTEPPGEL